MGHTNGSPTRVLKPYSGFGVVTYITWLAIQYNCSHILCTFTSVLQLHPSVHPLSFQNLVCEAWHPHCQTRFNFAFTAIKKSAEEQQLISFL